MCGIAGFFVDNKHVNSITPNLIEALSNLRHRGPDDSGIEQFDNGVAKIGLAQTRLSIIDLTNAGHQPMSTKDLRFTIIFNGEIYNYLELRSELEGHGLYFNGNSDTEILLAAWVKWGEKILPRLVGMFAFVVYDAKFNTLTLVRDGFGIKPLYIARSDWGICFASEMSAIIRLRNQVPHLNLQRVCDYLLFNDYDSSELTFVEGIEHLSPGTIEIYDLQNNKLSSSSKWWTPDSHQKSSLSFEDASVKLRDLFLENIRLHLRSDVKLGAALSGGIDSSAIVCGMRILEPKKPIHTFSYVAKNSQISEEAWVDHINKHTKATPHKIYVDEYDLALDLDEMIVCQGEPFGSTSIYAQYRVYKMAKQCDVIVTLDGQGADELLAGYHGYPGKRAKSLINKGRIIEALLFLYRWSKWPDRKAFHGLKLAGSEFLDVKTYRKLRAIFSRGDISQKWLNLNLLTECGVRTIYPLNISSDGSGDRVLIDALINAATIKGLPGLLRHSDRNSMHFSVESRVPFLTTELANFLFSLPEEYLISQDGQTKHIFRHAMRGIVPDNILDRKDKIGFSTPENEWIKKILSTSDRWISEDPELFFLNHKFIKSEIQKVLDGHSKYSSQIWRWVNFYKWYQLVFKEFSRSNTLLLSK